LTVEVTKGEIIQSFSIQDDEIVISSTKAIVTIFSLVGEKYEPNQEFMEDCNEILLTNFG